MHFRSWLWSLGAVFLSLSSPVTGGDLNTEFTVVNGAEPLSLDPHYERGGSDRRLGDALFEGLVVSDNQTTEARPGLAESWKVEADGRTYTFTLRKTTWSDGVPITAQTVVDSWIRELDPHTASPSSDLVASLVVGGREFHHGQSYRGSVLIRALDAVTFRATFVGPLATMSILSHPGFAVVPLHTIARFGQDWTRPQNFVGNGPFVLESWVPGSKVTVVPNAKYWDQKSIKLTRIVFLSIDDRNTGYALYLKGTVDWLPEVPVDRIEEARRRRDFQTSPTLGVSFYRLNTSLPSLSDPRVRKALALAIDRTTLVRRLGGGQRIARSFSPPMPSAPPSFAGADDAKAARRLLAEAGYQGGRGFPRLTLLYPTSEGERRVAEFVRDEWKRKLGIDVDLLDRNWPDFLEAVASGTYEIARGGWVADYSDPLAFLDLWTSPPIPLRLDYSSTAYDTLIAKAKGQNAGPARTKTLREAEAVLMADLPLIPLYHHASNQMIDLTKWDGWYANVLDVHGWKNVGPRK